VNLPISPLPARPTASIRNEIQTRVKDRLIIVKRAEEEVEKTEVSIKKAKESVVKATTPAQKETAKKELEIATKNLEKKKAAVVVAKQAAEEVKQELKVFDEARGTIKQVAKTGPETSVYIFSMLFGISLWYRKQRLKK